jgi:hypothetical protein
VSRGDLIPALQYAYAHATTRTFTSGANGTQMHESYGNPTEYSRGLVRIAGLEPCCGEGAQQLDDASLAILPHLTGWNERFDWLLQFCGPCANAWVVSH